MMSNAAKKSIGIFGIIISQVQKNLSEDAQHILVYWLHQPSKTLCKLLSAHKNVTNRVHKSNFPF